MYKCLHLYIKENRWDGYVENGGGKVPQLDPGGPGGGGVCAYSSLQILSKCEKPYFKAALFPTISHDIF